MKVKIQQFLFSSNHSWACVGKEIGRSLLKKGHDVHFISMDKNMQVSVIDKYVPEDLREHIKMIPDRNYDCQISYTAMQNFPFYLSNGIKNRFGIWNYEFPDFRASGFSKYHQFTDKFLPSSKFFYDICKENGLDLGKFIEDAILDKLEEIVDVQDIKKLKKESFTPFEDVVKDLKKNGKL